MKQQHFGLVDAHGRPIARTGTPTRDKRCPQCGKGPEKRVPSCMGEAHPVCPCGYEFFDERWV